MSDTAVALRIRPSAQAMNRRQSMSFFALVPVALGVSAFVAMAAKDQSYVPSLEYAPTGVPSRKAAVVYYSRSGHSEAVAREIARLLNTPIARITADYPLSFSGQGKALADAGGNTLPTISLEPVDLHSVQRVYLVSPTWLFRPATPLWAYVEQTDLTGKEVVLFTTGNSRFEQAEIEAFAKRVEAHGGQLIRHVFLRRGRIYWQMSRDELLDAARLSALGIDTVIHAKKPNDF